MTYRLMAEWATDLICRKIGSTEKCRTAEIPLPGSAEKREEVEKKIRHKPLTQRRSAISRHGALAEQIGDDSLGNSLVCECEEVSIGEVEYAMEHLAVNNLVDLRRRTRVGMGTCQGELCACRAAGLMGRRDAVCARKAKADLASFLNERWKGMQPIAWGDTLRESEYTTWVYEGVCGLSDEKTAAQ